MKITTGARGRRRADMSLIQEAPQQKASIPFQEASLQHCPVPRGSNLGIMVHRSCARLPYDLIRLVFDIY